MEQKLKFKFFNGRELGKKGGGEKSVIVSEVGVFGRAFIAFYYVVINKK